MSQLKVNSIVDASGGSNAVLYGPASPAGSMGFRNRIINGAMVIDQRNAGASVSTGSGSGVYTMDRWHAYYNATSKYTIQQNAGSVTPPAGFTNYLGVTSSSAYTVGSAEEFSINQYIEGFNWCDLGWGTANAKTVTLSFWVRSSLTGTFGGAFRNYAGTRSYPYSYTISSANTWEYKTITIAGDTSGTWVGASANGALIVGFGLGVGSSNSNTAGAWVGGNYQSATGATSVVGTNGATFYITGVQLEVGSVATEFERRPYGTELQLCQRYFQAYQLRPAGGINGFCDSTTDATFGFTLCQQMRSAPTLGSSGTSSNYRIRKSGGTDITLATGPSLATASTSITRIDATVASGLTAGQAVLLEGSGTGSTEYPITFSAEL